MDEREVEKAFAANTTAKRIRWSRRLSVGAPREYSSPDRAFPLAIQSARAPS